MYYKLADIQRASMIGMLTGATLSTVTCMVMTWNARTHSLLPIKDPTPVYVTLYPSVPEHSAPLTTAEFYKLGKSSIWKGKKGTLPGFQSIDK